MSKRKKWLIYALGSGWGHLNRALSLARLAANSRQVEIVCNTPYADLFSDEDLDVQVVRLETRSPSEAKEYFLSLSWSDYECFIVDTFPRGIVGELVDVLPMLHSVHKILVARFLNAQYVSQYQVKEFVSRHYDLTIDPGDNWARTFLQTRSVQTPPWLVRNHDQLPDVATIRQRFDVPNDRPFILVVASGPNKDLAFYGELTQQISHALSNATTKCLSFERPQGLGDSQWIRHWPGIECIAACDIAIGGAGYNTVNECRALDVPLIAIPRRRMYDDQARRSQFAAWQCGNIEAVFSALNEALHNDIFQVRSSFRPYENGAEIALEQITRSCRAHCTCPRPQSN